MSILNRARKLLLEVHGALDRGSRYDRLARLSERYRDVGAEPGSLVDGQRERDLTPYEYSVFSQNGEGGVLCELTRQMGEGNPSFVEFGTETGMEGNCVFLAEVRGWSGLFMEGGDAYEALARRWAGRDRVVTAGRSSRRTTSTTFSTTAVCRMSRRSSRSTSMGTTITSGRP